MSDEQEVEWMNSVHLVGRITTAGQEIELPSGDMLVKFRIVIPRDRPISKTTVDTIDCVVDRKSLHKKVLRFFEGEIVEIEGQLRRRFWKAGPGVASKLEVEVHSVGKL